MKLNRQITSGVTTETSCYTAPAITNVKLSSVWIWNTTANDSTITVKLNGVVILNNMTVPTASGYTIGSSGDGVMFLLPGDEIKVTATATVNVVVSAVEL